VLGSWGGAVLCGVALAARTRRVETAVLEPELLRIKTFATASLATLAYSAGFYALLLCNVLFLSDVWRYSVLEAGFGVSAGPIAAAVGAAIAGRLAEHRGPRGLIVGGALATAGAMLMYRSLPGTTPDYLTTWLPCQLASGASAGVVFASLSTATVTDLPANRIATGTALSSCLRQVGAVLGISILVAILDNATPAHLTGDFHDAYLFMAFTAVTAAVIAVRLPAHAPEAIGDASLLRNRVAPSDVPGLSTHTVDLDGTRVVYRTAGDGPPLVLIHGLLDSGKTWRRLAPVLAVRYRVIVPDLLGHGDTDGPVRGDYSVDGHARLVRDLLDHLGIEQTVLVGHSLGAAVTTAFTANWPQRVNKLALLSAGGIGPELNPALRVATLPGAGLLLRGLGSRPVVFVLRTVAGLVRLCGARRPAHAIAESTRMLQRLGDAGTRGAFLESARAVTPAGTLGGVVSTTSAVVKVPLLPSPSLPAASFDRTR